MNVLARQIFGDAFSEFLRDYTTTLLAARKERRGECVRVAVYDAEDEGTCLRRLMMAASAPWPQNGSKRHDRRLPGICAGWRADGGGSRSAHYAPWTRAPPPPALFRAPASEKRPRAQARRRGCLARHSACKWFPRALRAKFRTKVRSPCWKKKWTNPICAQSRRPYYSQGGLDP